MADVIERRKVGRPARLDRDMIAKAAHEVGLDRVTMKAVADRLGVSVPGLYHHIEGRDDLMRLAAEYSASRIPLPVDRGQHWAAWLLEWAQYSHDAFVAQPELLGQFLHGSLSAERMVIALDTIMGLLVRHGFSPAEARDAYMVVSETAVGAAVSEIREAEAARSGRPAVVEYHRALAQHGADEFPNLRALVAAPDDRPVFADRIRTVLVGIAVQRGESPAVIDLTDAPSGSAPGGLGSLHH